MTYTCSKCGSKFDAYSGKLVRISDSLIKELPKYFDSDFNPLVNKVDGKVKHFMLCSDCIESYLNRYLTVHELKFIGTKQYWYDSNLYYFISRCNFESESYKKEVINFVKSHSKGCKTDIPLLLLHPYAAVNFPNISLLKMSL